MPTASNNLFFKNGDKSYGPVSALQTIINKSDMDVGVKLSLEVTKGANDDNLVFAKSVSAVKAISGVPAIYLAVGSGDATVAPVSMQGEAAMRIDTAATKTTGSAVITGVAWEAAAYEPEDGTPPEEPDPTSSDYLDEDGVFNADSYAEDVETYEEYLAAVAAQEARVADFLGVAAAGITFTGTSTKEGTSNAVTEVEVADINGYTIEAGDTAGVFAVTVAVPAPTEQDEDATEDVDIGKITLTVVDASNAGDENETVAVVKPAYFIAKDESTAPSTPNLLTGVKFEFADDVSLADKEAFATALTANGVDVKAKYTHSSTTYDITDPTVSGYTFTAPASVGLGENVYAVTSSSGNDVVDIGSLTVTLAVAADPTADIAEETGTLKVTYDESKVAASEIKGVVADAGLYIDDYKSDAATGKSKYIRTLGQITKADGTKADPTDDDFNKAVFYVTGNINEDIAWDKGLEANDNDQTDNAVGAGLGLKLVWDVNEVQDDYTDALSEDAPSVGGNAKPSVTVKTKGTKGSTATSATLDVSLGSGDLKAESVAFKVNTTSLVYNDSTGVLTIPKAQANAASGWKAIFTYALKAGETEAVTYEVEFDPFTVTES